MVNFKKGSRKRRQSIISDGGWRLLNFSDTGAVVASVLRDDGEKVVVCSSLGGNKQRQYHSVLQNVPSQKLTVHLARNDRNKGEFLLYLVVYTGVTDV